MKRKTLIEWFKSLGRDNSQKSRKKELLLDKNGEPITWYRGMRASDFRDDGITAISDGKYFCDAESVASSYSSDGFVLRAHISVANPFIIDAKNEGYEYIRWACDPSSMREFSKFKRELQKEYKGFSVDRFSTDEIARFIRNNTSHDAVIIRNVFEEGIFNNFAITDIVIWDNACFEAITD